MAGAGERSAEERRDLASKGQAMPDGSFPVGTRDEVEKAVSAVGRASNNSAPAIRRMIMRNAKRIGCTDCIPDTWKSDGTIEAALIRARGVRRWLLLGG